MAFFVPALEPHLHARFNFGACKIPAQIPDPGNVPGTGIVYMRGALSADPMYKPPVPMPPTGLVTLFTLPAGNRPASTRWFSILVTTYLGMFDAKPLLCVVHPNGKVDVKTGGVQPSVDGAFFFDGLSFIAEQ